MAPAAALLVLPGSVHSTASAGVGTSAAVATESAYAAEAALAVLREGGNVVDAAVTAVFVMGVVRPDMCGIGGGGFLVHWGADGVASAVDFREQAPATYEYRGGIGFEESPGRTVFSAGTGHRVVGVPGIVAGLTEALEELGTVDLERAIAPAAEIARDGFVVSERLSKAIGSRRGDLALFPESARLYLYGPDAVMQGADDALVGADPADPPLLRYSTGDTMVLEQYAADLDEIAEQGPSAFYEGRIAEAIVDELRRPSVDPRDMSQITMDDFKNYRAKVVPALEATYRGRTIIAMPPPTSGGVTTIEMLNILSGFDLAAMGHASSDRIHVMAEAHKLAWADRDRYLGDPYHQDIPVATLTDTRFAAERRKLIDMGSVLNSYEPGIIDGAHQGGGAASSEAGMNTTHVSVVDSLGNAVAVTCSMEQALGSGVVAPGTGFLLNNTLTDFGEAGTANAPAPGRRPLSSMSPTIVLSSDRPVLVVGGAGGKSIINGVVQSIVNAVDFGFSGSAALAAPRLDGRAFATSTRPEALMLENPTVGGVRHLPSATIDDLRRRGHDVDERAGLVLRPRLTAVGVAQRGAAAFVDPRSAEGIGEL